VSTAGAVDDRHDDRSLVQPFRRGLLAVAIGFVLIGSLIAAFGSSANRPEGVAERWLTDVGDTRRDGIDDRAREEAEAIGPVELAADLLPEEDTGGDSAFVDLEIGKAEHDGDLALVPFRLHQRQGDETGPAVEGTLVLRELPDDDEGWRVEQVTGPIEGQAVPSEGGDPAAEAPIGLFLGAVAVSVVVAVVCSGIVRAAGRAAEASAPPR
jgi:hypothetical protein